MFRAFCGWLAGCGAATVVIVGLGGVLFGGPSASLLHPVAPLSMLLNPLSLVFTAACAMTAFPAMFLISLSIDLQTRLLLFYGVAGSLLGALCISLLVRSLAVWFWICPLFALAGLAAGLTYWFVAGRHALCERTA